MKIVLLLCSLWVIVPAKAHAFLDSLFQSKADKERVVVCQRAQSGEGDLAYKMDDIKEFAKLYETWVKPYWVNQNCAKLEDFQLNLTGEGKSLMYTSYVDSSFQLQDACNARIILACLNKMTRDRINAYEKAYPGAEVTNVLVDGQGEPEHIHPNASFELKKPLQKSEFQRQIDEKIYGTPTAK